MKHHLLLAALMVGTQATHAQPFGMGDHRPFERIQQLRKVRMIEMLDLKEEQSVRFFARLNEHEDKKRDLMKEKNDLLDKIERLVRNRGDDKDFEELFPQVLTVNTKIVEEDQRFFNSLGDILTVEQRGKYLLFERQFERELREAMRDIQRRRRGREEP